MPNEDMRALIHRRRKGSLQLVSDGQGRGGFAPIEPENAGDDEQEKRVVDGSADGGAGRADDTAGATDMNRLLRSQWIARAGTIKADV